MDRLKLISAGIMIGAGAWLMLRDHGQNWNGTARAVRVGAVDMKAMKGLDVPKLLQSANLRAFLMAIRAVESRTDDKAWGLLNGCSVPVFSDFSKHPAATLTEARKLCKSAKSTAAGAFQLVAASWAETARIMKLTDFTQESQTAAAVGRIEARGALRYVLAGDFDRAWSILGNTEKNCAAPFYCEFQGCSNANREKGRAVYLANGGSLDG